MTGDVRDKIEKLDEEILRLLADRVALSQEEDDPDVLGAEYQADVLAQWDASADEHGWNPGFTAKICRGVLELCKPLE